MAFRFKTGELVELSAAGRRNKQNDKVYDMIGVVLSHEKHLRHCLERDRFPYKIHWFGYNDDGNSQFPMKEYEIKRVRGEKCR